MNELRTNIDIFIEELNRLETIKALENDIINIKSNKELVEKIKKYHLSPNQDLKLDIYSYKEIKDYKNKETNLNLLIMEINKYLNKIKKDKGCIR